MKKHIAFFLFLVSSITAASQQIENAKQYFQDAKMQLENMLNGKETLSYEQAIFIMENAWYENGLDKTNFEAVISRHVQSIQEMAASNYDVKAIKQKPGLLYSKKQIEAQYKNALTNWAIYTYITKPSIFIQDSNQVFYHQPYTYSFADPMATTDWRNTQIVNLNNTKEGNCFALASLFKIFSGRLHSEANLCTAPSHIYIRHADEKGTPYNVELGVENFPGTGILSAVTYTTDQAIQNNIAQRELNTQQSIALCLVYLAKGYEHKFNNTTDDFILQCAEAAIRYDSKNLNALLLKAEYLENKITATEKTIPQLQTGKDFQDYQNLIANLYNLGYREMPNPMKDLIIRTYKGEKITQEISTPPNKIEQKYATLTWGIFDERHTEKQTERIGNTIFNTQTKKITAFAKDQHLFNNYNFDPVVFAWNIDPLFKKFPWQSPYAAFDNSPIWKNDPTGQSGEPVASGNTLTIYSNIIFYGGAANAKLANQAAKNIQTQWNNAGGTVEFNGKEYQDVKFVVTAQVVSETVAKSMAAGNKGDNYDPRLNFARIENVTGIANSFAAENGKRGDNSFFLKAQDIVPGNTSQAHEYGHGLGLTHVSAGTFITGIPNIMSTIQNGVDAPYSIDGQKSQFVDGQSLPLHQMNQNCRQVTQEDINGIHYEVYQSNYGSGTMAGSSSNVLYNAQGATEGGKGKTYTTGDKSTTK